MFLRRILLSIPPRCKFPIKRGFCNISIYYFDCVGLLQIPYPQNYVYFSHSGIPLYCPRYCLCESHQAPSGIDMALVFFLLLLLLSVFLLHFENVLSRLAWVFQASLSLRINPNTSGSMQNVRDTHWVFFCLPFQNVIPCKDETQFTHEIFYRRLKISVGWNLICISKCMGAHSIFLQKWSSWIRHNEQCLLRIGYSRLWSLKILFVC